MLEPTLGPGRHTGGASSEPCETGVKESSTTLPAAGMEAISCLSHTAVGTPLDRALDERTSQLGRHPAPVSKRSNGLFQAMAMGSSAPQIQPLDSPEGPE